MECLHPITLPISRINRETGELSRAERYTVPCGKCPNCRSNYRSQWTFRLWHEAKGSEFNNYFVTLTYDEVHIPLYLSNGSLNPCFSKSDCQKFMKRLRKSISSQIRFYLVCEYGENTGRPHYHILLFNVDSDLDSLRQIIESKWTFGRVSCDLMTDQRIGYCTKYCLKEIDEFLQDHPKSDPRVPFCLMSQGIGRSYLSRQINTVKFEPSNLTINPMNGKKTVLPRYYKNKFFNDDDKVFLAMKGKEFYLSHRKTNQEVDYEYDELLIERSKRLHRHKSKM